MLVASVVCGGALVLAAAMKVADPNGSRVALGTYRAGWALWPLVAAEGVLGVALLAGVPGAGPLASGLFAAFAIAQGLVLARGGGGAPCGCLGARGTVSAASAARVAALAVLAAFAGGGHPALAAAATAVAAIAATLLNRAPRGALDVADEGPAIGSVLDGPPGLRLFTAEGCRLCARVKRGLSDYTELDEERDAGAWLAARVPGAPYAVVVGDDGRVRAKGTVNTAAQARALAGISRRTLIGRAAAAVAVGGMVRPGEAEAYHFCGHIYTTDSCPHPTGLPRIDKQGFPLRARDGHPVDDLGRLIDREGRPVGEDGEQLRDPDGRVLPSASRTRVCTATGRRYGFATQIDGAWYRCCKGHVRKLVDCCSTNDRRINGDTALQGYCYGNRKVFCVMFFQTRVPC
jgi:methylamine utilization protein MauE